ncbi:LysR family glycine cleavage system transcriptional activator [Bradyrhizobium diazoefficiens]|jgi:LysR family transcriptional regulator, glycine cleavage system transcriptional activator|uniref:LysR family transcriptional regulator n=1 Tax=Bradyrhizobium TaxID=374 RepID=UPI002729C7FC|nr:LysR family transcriptional regulator [Bradyrhizobium diazoefficiens]WLA59923.1 LysR family transcriptional regulator [Bradyrhizobium diazoefficiens]
MLKLHDMRRRLVPDIVNLQAFECAARHQNFSRAAQELNLTQSAVSRQVAELEQQTGLRLFERIRQRVVLSEAGQRLLPEVRDLLVQSDRLMIGAVAAAQMRASLKIATLPTFGAKWLVPKLGRFLDQHRDVAVTIESRSRPFSFAEDNFDLAIHFGQSVWAGGTLTFLCHETVLPIASRALAETLRIGGAADLANAPILHLTTRPKLWAEWFELHEAPTDNAYHGVRFDQFSMIIAAAMSGLGVGLLPTYLVEEELRSKDLVPILDLPMSTENAYYVVRPETKRTHQAADLFETWLLSQVGIDKRDR